MSLRSISLFVCLSISSLLYSAITQVAFGEIDRGKHLAPKSFEVHVFQSGQDRLKNNFDEFLKIYDLDMGNMSFGARSIPIASSAQDKVADWLIQEFHSVFSSLFTGIDPNRRPEFVLTMGTFGYKSILEQSGIQIEPNMLARFGYKDGIILSLTASARKVGFFLESGELLDKQDIFPFAPIRMLNILASRGNGPNPLSIKFYAHAGYEPGKGLTITPLSAISNVKNINVNLNFKKLRVPNIQVISKGKTYTLDQKAVQTYVYNKLSEYSTQMKPLIHQLIIKEGPSWINEALIPLAEILRSSFELPLGESGPHEYKIPLDFFPQTNWLSQQGNFVIEYASALKGTAKQIDFDQAHLYGSRITETLNRQLRFDPQLTQQSDFMVRIMPEFIRLISEYLFNEGAYTRFGDDLGYPIQLSQPGVIELPKSGQTSLQVNGQDTAQLKAILDLKALGRSPLPKKDDPNFARKFAWVRLKNQINRLIERGLFKRDLRITFFIQLLPKLNVNKNTYEVWVNGIQKYEIDESTLRTKSILKIVRDSVREVVEQYNLDLSKNKEPFFSMEALNDLISIPVKSTGLKLEHNSLTAYFKLKEFKKITNPSTF